MKKRKMKVNGYTYQMAGVVLPNLNMPNVQPYTPSLPTQTYNPLPEQQQAPNYKRQFDPMQANGWGLGIMAAYAGSKALLNKTEEANYERYKKDWIRRYQQPSLIQDPNKFSSTEYESPIYQTGGLTGTQEQRAQAIQEAQRIGRKYNLMDANNLGIGKYLPQYVDENGNPVQNAPSKPLPITVPNYVTIDDLHSEQGQTWYVDPQTGDNVAVDPAVFRLPKFSRKMQGGGLSRQDDYGSKSHPYAGVAADDFAGPHRSYPIPTHADAVDALRLAHLHGAASVIQKVYAKYPDLRKKLGGVIDEMAYGGCAECNKMKDGGNWIQGAVNPAHKGYCTPMSKSTCTPRRKALARRFKAMAHKQDGGMTMHTHEQQGAGYYAYPNASSLTFPGQGERTFVPGPFPLMVKDSKGTQIMTNKPVKTYGKVIEIPMYEQGGEVRTTAPKVDRDDATIEAQKGELIFGAGAPGSAEDQNDRVGVGLYRIGGKKHSQGGTPLKAYPGDFVFSDESELAPSTEDAKLILGKEIKALRKRTPAKLASRYMDLNKHINMAQDPDMDDTTKQTALLNINNYIDKLADIAYAQEQKKGFPEGMPAFVQTSMETRFSQQGLQQDLNQFKYGGQVKKYQMGASVPDEVLGNASKVDKVPPGYNFYGARGNRQFYRNQSGQLVTVNQAIPGGIPGDPWKNFIINNLQNGVTIQELANKGHGTVPGLTKQFGQYYTPKQDNSFVYTSGNEMSLPGPTKPDLSPLPVSIFNRPAASVNPFETPQTSTTDNALNRYTEFPNSKFNVNVAEAAGLLAAGYPSESRYPPAFRNYEIQNAKALIASTGKPISEQPYLNAIDRSNLGFDQNNNPYGAPGATRSLAAYQASLTAKNQAISSVYNQNIARQDQTAQQLAQLEIQDGIDRITNAEKYDNKLEMLANNKELEARNRAVNVSNIVNQMQSDRESKRLLNQMSEFYNIAPNGSISLKPTYQIVDGKLIPYQRSVSDLIKSRPVSTSQYNPALQLAQELENLGYDKDQISRIISKSVDDYDKLRR